MLNELIGTVLQVIVFGLIPFIVYLIVRKKIRGFPAYVGLKKLNRRANMLAVLVSLVFLVPALGLTLLNEEVSAVMHNPDTLTGRFHEMGPGFESIVILLLAAVFKTSFSEELFFSLQSHPGGRYA